VAPSPPTRPGSRWSGCGGPTSGCATRLAQAEKIIQIQGKVSELLGIPLDPASDEEQSASS
jgi:hypothetical protein